MNKKFIPPLPFLLILAVFLTEILILVRFKYDFFKPGHGKIWLVHILAVVSVIFIYKRWIAALPVCSLFYGPSRMERFDSSGNFICHEDLNEQCGKKSVGKVKVISDSRGGSTEYFCEGHDPEIGWMKNWLRRQGIKIYPETIKKFSKTDDDDDQGGPDLTLRFL